MFRRLFLIGVCLPSLAFADVNKEMNKFFNKFGSSANYSSADIYQGQKAGYFTVGNLTMRNRLMHSRLFNVDLPRFDAGCGGIDIYAGGFSFLSGEELVNAMKSVGTASASYAFMLGIETVSPQVANSIKQLQTWANHMNSLSINSCEAGSQIAGMVWPKDTQASQHICRSLGGSKGHVNDYIAARHSCGQSEEFSQTMDKIASDSKFKDVLTGDYNLTWEALKKHEFFSNNKDLAELMMTLVGTVVVKNGDGKDVSFYPPKLEDEDFLEKLLNGGLIEVYSSSKDDEKALNLASKSVKVDRANSWNGRVEESLKSIQDSILKDQEITADDMEILKKASLPLYKIINVYTAYRGRRSPTDLLEVSEPVAMDLLTQYLREVIDLVKEGLIQLREGQFYADKIDQQIASLNDLERRVLYYEGRSIRQMERSFHMMQKVQLIEEQVASSIDLGWGE